MHGPARDLQRVMQERDLDCVRPDCGVFINGAEVSLQSHFSLTQGGRVGISKRSLIIFLRTLFEERVVKSVEVGWCVLGS